MGEQEEKAAWKASGESFVLHAHGSRTDQFMFRWIIGLQCKRGEKEVSGESLDFKAAFRLGLINKRQQPLFFDVSLVEFMNFLSIHLSNPGRVEKPLPHPRPRKLNGCCFYSFVRKVWLGRHNTAREHGPGRYRKVKWQAQCMKRLLNKATEGPVDAL